MTTIARPPTDDAWTSRLYRWLSSIPTWVLWIFVMIWTLPTFSLFVNSFRSRDAQRASGWWTFPNDEEFLNLQNYSDVLGAEATGGLKLGLVNSFAIAIPATIIPIAIAAFAAYGFAWIDFKGPASRCSSQRSRCWPCRSRWRSSRCCRLFNNGWRPLHPAVDSTRRSPCCPDLDLAGSDDGRVADPHRVRHALRHLLVAQLHLARCLKDHVRGGPHRRRRPLHDLLASRAAVVGAGAGGVRHLPVPLDLERLPDRAHHDRGEWCRPPRDDQDCIARR